MRQLLSEGATPPGAPLSSIFHTELPTPRRRSSKTFPCVSHPALRPAVRTGSPAALRLSSLAAFSFSFPLFMQECRNRTDCQTLPRKALIG